MISHWYYNALPINNRMRLNAAGIEHYADRPAEARWRQVAEELSPHGANAAMGASDATPDSAIVGPLLLRLGLVHVRDPLAEVKVDLLLGVHAFNAQKGGVVLLVPLGPNVAQDL